MRVQSFISGCWLLVTVFWPQEIWLIELIWLIKLIKLSWLIEFIELIKFVEFIISTHQPNLLNQPPKFVLSFYK